MTLDTDAACCENPRLREAAERAGVPFHRVGTFDLRGLYRVFRAERPQVVYLFGRFRTLAWAIAARLAGPSPKCRASWTMRRTPYSPFVEKATAPVPW